MGGDAGRRHLAACFVRWSCGSAGGAPAVAIMSVAMLLLLVLPLWLAIDTILEHSGQLAAAGKSLAGMDCRSRRLGGRLPLIGERAWQGPGGRLAAGGGLA